MENEGWWQGEGQSSWKNLGKEGRKKIKMPQVGRFFSGAQEKVGCQTFE